MSSFCEGGVVIVTGAGRGIGRDYAKLLAAHGAKVVVNDLGGGMDGTGASLTPAEEVVGEIRAAGGEAVANGEDVSSWDGSKRMLAMSASLSGSHSRNMPRRCSPLAISRQPFSMVASSMHSIALTK